MRHRWTRSILVTLVAISMLAIAGCVVAYQEPTPPRPAPRPAPPPPPPPPPPVRPPVTLDVSYFYDALDPYGDWLWIDPYGWVWAPNAVDPFWRPYTVGRWVWTDWGWTWASRERWGWATYHYGRWTRLGRSGWVWVPDTVWAPAWVAWRMGGAAVGWAPLPPQVRYRSDVGLDWGGGSIDVLIQPDRWCFVDSLRFDEPDVVRWAYPVGRNATVIRGTRDATRMRVVDRRIVNEGFGREEIERATRRAVPVRRIRDAAGAGERGAVVGRDDVTIYRPEVREGRPGAEPRRGRRIATEGRTIPEARPAPERPPAPEVKPAPAPPRPPAARPAPRGRDPETEAEREWDRRWLQDWRKLERAQEQEARKEAPAASPAPASKPVPPESIERVRDENREAAENARREQLAARERAKRRAERAPARKAAKKGAAAEAQDQEEREDGNE